MKKKPHVQEESFVASGIPEHRSGGKFDIHPLAELLLTPRNAAERAELKQSIAETGLQNPGVLFEGKLLKGAYEQDICEELGIPFLVTEFSGDTSAAVKHLVSEYAQGLPRRAGQRAIIAGRLSDLIPGSNQHKTRGSAKLRNLTIENLTQDSIGKMLGISIRYVTLGKKIVGFSEKLAAAVIANAVPLKLAEAACEWENDEVEKVLKNDNPKKSLQELIFGIPEELDEQKATLQKIDKACNALIGFVRKLPEKKYFSQCLEIHKKIIAHMNASQIEYFLIKMMGYHVHGGLNESLRNSLTNIITQVSEKSIGNDSPDKNSNQFKEGIEKHE